MDESEERRWWSRQNRWIGVWAPAIMSLLAGAVVALVEGKYGWALVLGPPGLLGSWYVDHQLRHTEAARSNDNVLYVVAMSMSILALLFVGLDIYHWLSMKQSAALRDQLATEIENLTNERAKTANLVQQVNALKSQLATKIQELGNEKSQLDQTQARYSDAKQRLNAKVDGIKHENYPQKILDAQANIEAATERRRAAENEYYSQKWNSHVTNPPLYGAMTMAENAEKYGRSDLAQIEKDFTDHLDALRQP